MSGGAWEYVAAYVDNENSNLETYGSNLRDAADKYKDIYSVGITDSFTNNYIVSTPENGYYGDAIYEISSNSDALSWYNDYANFPYSGSAFFYRGGGYAGTTGVGIFSFSRRNGEKVENYGFRLVISLL